MDFGIIVKYFQNTIFLSLEKWYFFGHSIPNLSE
jgi:hypothetical protein